jgi:hypothetical protein
MFMAIWNASRSPNGMAMKLGPQSFIFIITVSLLLSFVVGCRLMGLVGSRFAPVGLVALCVERVSTRLAATVISTELSTLTQRKKKKAIITSLRDRCVCYGSSVARLA